MADDRKGKGQFSTPVFNSGIKMLIPQLQFSRILPLQAEGNVLELTTLTGGEQASSPLTILTTLPRGCMPAAYDGAQAR